MRHFIFFFLLFFHFCAFGAVLAGLDVLESEEFIYLKNKNVALLANKTSVNKNGVPILDLLKKHGIKVAKIFSPEHGFHTDKDEIVQNSSVDNIPVISLYGKTRKPSPEQLKGIDVVVYDIADAGVRYYTYISTLSYMMETVSKAGIEIIVVDRPVIIGGDKISGFVPEKELTGFFTSIFPIPTRYGMTAGELALLFNEHFKLNATLTVVKMKNYSRSMLFDETRLPWISPSPNLNSLESALLYSELGWLETVNLSMGRGTDTPFQLIGAPFIDEKKLFEELKKNQFAGLSIEPARFTPKAKVHKHFGKECGGIKISVTDRKNNQAFKLGIELLKTLLKLYQKQIQISKDFALMTGSKELEDLIRKNTPFEQIEKKAQISRKEFEKIRGKYLIYK
jgi:uncharacterized protein YbbC (DUF1343 family)